MTHVSCAYITFLFRFQVCRELCFYVSSFTWWWTESISPVKLFIFRSRCVKYSLGFPSLIHFSICSSHCSHVHLLMSCRVMFRSFRWNLYMCDIQTDLNIFNISANQKSNCLFKDGAYRWCFNTWKINQCFDISGKCLFEQVYGDEIQYYTNIFINAEHHKGLDECLCHSFHYSTFKQKHEERRERQMNRLISGPAWESFICVCKIIVKLHKAVECVHIIMSDKLIDDWIQTKVHTLFYFLISFCRCVVGKHLQKLQNENDDDDDEKLHRI